MTFAAMENERTVTAMAKYINRDELVDWLKRIPLKDLSDGLGLCRIIMEEDFKQAIRTIPKGAIVDLEPVVHGVWIPVHESEISGWNPEVAGIDPIDGYICSACKNEAIYDCNDKFVLSDYCPNCGARMDGEAE